MGVNIQCGDRNKGDTTSCGYGSFMKLREAIRHSCLNNEKELIIRLIKKDRTPIENLWENLQDAYFDFDNEDDKNTKILFDFFRTPDCGGKLKWQHAKVIYDLIDKEKFKEIKMFNFIHCRGTKEDMTKHLFDEFLKILEYSIENKRQIEWF